jgi:hypothetical protein
MKAFISIIIISIIAASCSVNPNEYINWIEDTNNGFRKEIKDINSIDFVQLKTPNYLALKELSGESNWAEQFENIKAGYNDLILFEIRFKEDFITNLTKKNQHNITYDAGDLFHIEVTDSIYKTCLYQYEPYDAAKPYSCIFLGFPNSIDINNNDFKLNLNLSKIGFTDKSITFLSKELKKVPTLKI